MFGCLREYSQAKVTSRNTVVGWAGEQEIAERLYTQQSTIFLLPGGFLKILT